MKKILFILITFIYTESGLLAEVPYYIDFQQILNQSTAGKKAQDELKKKLDQTVKKLNKTQKDLQEQNLNTVILLNPKNEEALYNLAKMKLESSDYKKSKELKDTLISLCDLFCSESKKLKTEIENLSKK